MSIYIIAFIVLMIAWICGWIAPFPNNAEKGRFDEMPVHFCVYFIPRG